MMEVEEGELRPAAEPSRLIVQIANEKGKKISIILCSYFYIEKSLQNVYLLLITNTFCINNYQFRKCKLYDASRGTRVEAGIRTRKS